MFTSYKQYEKPRKGSQTHYAKWTSIMRKLDNQLNKEVAELKKKDRSDKGSK